MGMWRFLVSQENSSAPLPLALMNCHSPLSFLLFQQVPWRYSIWGPIDLLVPPHPGLGPCSRSHAQTLVCIHPLCSRAALLNLGFSVTLSFQCGVLWVSQVLGHPLRFLGKDHEWVPFETCCHSSLGASTLPFQCPYCAVTSEHSAC